MTNPVSQNDVTALMMDKLFIQKITDIKNEAGEQTVSPFQHFIDQRIRTLLPGFCFQTSFEPNYQAMRNAAFSTENNAAKNALTIVGLKSIDNE